MSHQMYNPLPGEPQVFGYAYASEPTLTTDMPARAPRLTRDEWVKIATAAVTDHLATCDDPYSSEGVGAAVVDALYGLAALDVDGAE